MAQINVTKKDLIWSYGAQVFTLVSGFITLPLILNKLSAEEVGMNYLMLTIGTLINLFDFGLSGQFGRNITYVLSGAQFLSKEGVAEGSGSEINNHLLACVIETAKYIYRRLSLLAFAIMITFGTAYIYKVTDGFTNIENSLLIWLIYVVSIYFNLYYIYYSALLSGASLIKESKQAMVYSKIVYIVLCITLIMCGFGLFSVVISNLIAPFVNRYFSYHYFYTEEMKERLKYQVVEKKELKETFQILWYNAKRLGINFIGAYCITQSGIFIAGLYLSLSDVGSYGLLMQLGQIIWAFASGIFNSYVPKFNSLRVEGENGELIRLFSMSSGFSYLVYIAGSLVVVFIAPWALTLIKSNSVLPSTLVMIVFFVNGFLTMNHSNNATLITTANTVPFVNAALFTGIFILIFNFLSLQFTSLGLFGIVLTTLICQSVYNHWKWPKWILDEFNISLSEFITMGMKAGYLKLQGSISKHKK